MRTRLASPCRPPCIRTIYEWMELQRESSEADRWWIWRDWKDGGTIRGSRLGASCSSAVSSSTPLFCSRFSYGRGCAPSPTGKWIRNGREGRSSHRSSLEKRSSALSTPSASHASSIDSFLFSLFTRRRRAGVALDFLACSRTCDAQVQR